MTQLQAPQAFPTATQAQVAIAPPLAAIYQSLTLYNSDRDNNEPGPERGSDRR